TGSFIILTMGLFIEALSILAANRSHKLTHRLKGKLSEFTPEAITRKDAQLLPFATLQLEPNNEKRTPYPDALFLERRTSRISLLPKPVKEEAVLILSELARSHNQRYEQINDAAKIESILKCNADALFEDLNAIAYHDEIVEWFRFTARSAKRTRDGLD